jgi:hypothetical protein
VFRSADISRIFFYGWPWDRFSPSTYMLSCQYYSSNTRYFCVPLLVPFHQCSVLLCCPVSTNPPVLSTSVVPCEYYSSSTQYFCVALSVLFLQYSELLWYAVSTSPSMLRTSVVPCQYRILTLLVPFHQCSVLLCCPVSTNPPVFSTSVVPCQYRSTSTKYLFVYIPRYSLNSVII